MKDSNKILSYPEVFNLTASDKKWVVDTISKMSLREKCAQMVMPWVLGDYIAEDSFEFKRMLNLVKKEKVGGLIFFKGNIINEALLINKMQKAADIPLLMASDFEYGPAMRLTDAYGFPSNMAVAAAGLPKLAYKMGKFIAEECRSIGITQNYAPVADVNNNPLNPIINVRSFSEDKDIVSQYCRAFIKGTASKCVLTTVKHFPGHGNTKIDSHNDIPSIKEDYEKLFSNELVPFKDAVKSGVHCVMIGHLDLPSLNSGTGIPATLSKLIINDILKVKLGFKGLIVTDAMNMNAVTKHFSAAEAAVMAVDAGIDLINMPPDEEIAINSIYNAVKIGRLSVDRINESNFKILSAKKWLGLDKNKFVNIPAIPKVIGSKLHLKLAEDIAEKSVTLVKNNKNIIPITPGRFHHPVCITITEGTEYTNEIFFQNWANDYFYNLVKIIINKRSNNSDYQKAFLAAQQSDLIFIPSFVKIKAYTGTVQLSKKNTDFIKSLLKLNTSSALISFGNPYLLSLFPDAKIYLCAYGDQPVSQKAILKAITGKITIGGKLPISIPGTDYKIGDGINIDFVSI